MLYERSAGALMGLLSLRLVDFMRYRACYGVDDSVFITDELSLM